MADPNATPPAHPVGPATVEAFIADRQRFWSGFTRATVMGIVAVVVLLLGMLIFLA